MKKLLYISIILLLSSCASQERCQSKYPCLTKSDTITKEIIKDTTIFIRPDESWLQALIRCDSNGQILLDSLRQKQGTRTLIKWLVKDNRIYVNCIVDSTAIYLQYKARETTITTNNTQVVEPTETKLQRILKWIFWIVLVLASVYVVSVVYRSFKK